MIDPEIRAQIRAREAQIAARRALIETPWEQRGPHPDAVPAAREYQIAPGFSGTVRPLNLPAADLSHPRHRAFVANSRRNVPAVVFDPEVGSFKGRYRPN